MRIGRRERCMPSAVSSPSKVGTCEMVEQGARVAVAGERRVTLLDRVPARQLRADGRDDALQRLEHLLRAGRRGQCIGGRSGDAGERVDLRESSGIHGQHSHTSRRERLCEPLFEQRQDLRPLIVDDREHRDVAQPGPVGAPRVLAEDTLERGADARDGAPRALVPRVGLDLHAGRAERLERVLEQEQLGRRIDAGAMPPAAVPGVPDLDAPVGRCDVEVARRAGGDASAEHREGQARPGGRFLERLPEPRRERRVAGDRPGEREDGGVGCRRSPGRGTSRPAEGGCTAW